MNFTAFFSYIFLTAFTPGPNNIMSMSNASKYGFRKSFGFNMGVLLGFLVVMSCCAGFASLLYGLMPSVKPVMLVIGALYILRLAWAVWRDAPHGDGGGIARTNGVLSGMVLQFANIKVILFGITALTSFVLPHYHDLLTIAGAVLVLSVVGFAGTCAWALFGAVFERFFRRHGKLVNAVMALLLVYCAVSMLADLWK